MPNVPPLLSPTRESWIHQKSVVLPVALLSGLICFPIGLVFLWCSRAFSRRAKVATTVIVACIFALLLWGFYALAVAGNAAQQRELQEFIASHSQLPAARDDAKTRAEIRALFVELEGFRNDPQFHAKGFSKVGRSDWMSRMESIVTLLEKEEWGQTLRAAQDVKNLAEEYHRSKGGATNSVRIFKESIEEALSDQGGS